MARLQFIDEEAFDRAERLVRHKREVVNVGERRVGRARTEIEFSLRDEWGWGPIALTSRDISSGGVFLASELLFAKGEGFVLEFTSPTTGETIRAWSRVARVVESADEASETDAGMAFEFVDLSERHRADLANYVDRARSAA